MEMEKEKNWPNPPVISGSEADDMLSGRGYVDHAIRLNPEQLKRYQQALQRARFRWPGPTKHLDE